MEILLDLTSDPVSFSDPAKWGRIASDGMRILLKLSGLEKKASISYDLQSITDQITELRKRGFTPLYSYSDTKRGDPSCFLQG